jgi:CAAX protease family protein
VNRAIVCSLAQVQKSRKENQMKLLKRYPITAFFVLAYAFGWIFSLPNILGQMRLLPSPLPPFLGPVLFQLAPAISALIVAGAANGRTGIRALLRRVVIWRVNPWWYAISFGLPLLLQVVSIAAFVPLGGPAPYLDPSAFALLILFPVFFCSTMCEEIGWRGFALPRLQTRFNTLISATIVGVLWGFWHLPPTLPEFFQGMMSFQAFLLSILIFVGGSILLTWIFKNAKGSLLLTALFHTSSNAKSHFFPVAWQNSLFGPVELYGVLVLATAALVVFLTRSESLSRQGKRIQESTTPASQI